MRFFKVFVWFVAGLLLVQGPAGAVTVEELEQRIEALQRQHETEIQKLRAEIETLKGTETQIQEVRFTLQKSEEERERTQRLLERYGFEARGFGERISRNLFGFGDVSVGGYAALEFDNFENTDSRFDLQRWIINVGARLHDRLYFYSEYEIEHGGPNAPGGGEAKVEQAWVDYLINDWVNIRAGAILPPMGKYNLLHDDDLQDLTDRPIAFRRVIPGTWTEVGAGLHGNVYPGGFLEEGLLEDLSLNYEVYVVNGLDEDISDTGLRNAKGTLGNAADNNNKAVVGRLGISPIHNLELGVAGYTGTYGGTGTSGISGNDRINGFATDLDFRKGPFELVGEYVLFDLESGAFVDHDNDNTTAAVAGPDKLQGFYLEPRYHFWFDFLDTTFLGRNFENPTFTLVGRYGWVEIGDDGDTGTGDNEEARWTVGLNYRPNENFVFKTEYQFNDTKNESLEHGNNDGFFTSVAMGF